jgi:hypothetical protein
LQFEGSHFEALHRRAVESHERPCSAQSVHVAPERPQAVASVPARHVVVPPSALQHPPGHSAGPQFVTVRPQTRRPSQNWKPFAGQSAQLWPAVPQARESLPTRHVPFESQHPVEHVEGPQAPPSTLASVVSSSRLERPQPGVTVMKKSAADTASATNRRSEGMRMGEVVSGSVAEARQRR